MSMMRDAPMAPPPVTAWNSSLSRTYGRPAIVTGLVDCGMLIFGQLTRPITAKPAPGVSSGPTVRAWIALTS